MAAHMPLPGAANVESKNEPVKASSRGLGSLVRHARKSPTPAKPKGQRMDHVDSTPPQQAAVTGDPLQCLEDQYSLALGPTSASMLTATGGSMQNSKRLAGGRLGQQALMLSPLPAAPPTYGPDRLGLSSASSTMVTTSGGGMQTVVSDWEWRVCLRTDGHGDSVTCLSVCPLPSSPLLSSPPLSSPALSSPLPSPPLPSPWILTGGADNVLRVYGWQSLHAHMNNMAAGMHPQPLTPLLLSDWRENVAVTCMAPADERHVVTGDSTGRVRLWNLETSACDAVVHVSSEFPVKALGVMQPNLQAGAPFRPHLIYAAAGTDVGVWNLLQWAANDGGAHSRRKLKPVDCLTGHGATITCIDMLADGRIITGAADATLRVWGLEDKVFFRDDAVPQDDYTVRHVCQRVLVAHTEAVNSVAHMDDGRVISGSDDALALVWHIDDAAKCTRPCVLRGHTQAVTSVAPLVKTLVLTASLDQTIRQWSVPAGAPYGFCVQVITHESGPITCLRSAKFPSAEANQVFIISGTAAAYEAESEVTIWSATPRVSHDDIADKISAEKTVVVVSFKGDNAAQLPAGSPTHNPVSYAGSPKKAPSSLIVISAAPPPPPPPPRRDGSGSTTSPTRSADSTSPRAGHFRLEAPSSPAFVSSDYQYLQPMAGGAAILAANGIDALPPLPNVFQPLSMGAPPEPARNAIMATVLNGGLLEKRDSVHIDNATSPGAHAYFVDAPQPSTSLATAAVKGNFQDRLKSIAVSQVRTPTGGAADVLSPSSPSNNGAIVLSLAVEDVAAGPASSRGRLDLDGAAFNSSLSIGKQVMRSRVSKDELNKTPTSPQRSAPLSPSESTKWTLSGGNPFEASMQSSLGRAALTDLADNHRTGEGAKLRRSSVARPTEARSRRRSVTTVAGASVVDTTDICSPLTGTSPAVPMDDPLYRSFSKFMSQSDSLLAAASSLLSPSGGVLVANSSDNECVSVVFSPTIKELNRGAAVTLSAAPSEGSLAQHRASAAQTPRMVDVLAESRMEMLKDGENANAGGEWASVVTRRLLPQESSSPIHAIGTTIVLEPKRIDDASPSKLKFNPMGLPRSRHEVAVDAVPTPPTKPANRIAKAVAVAATRGSKLQHMEPLQASTPLSLSPAALSLAPPVQPDDGGDFDKADVQLHLGLDIQKRVLTPVEDSILPYDVLPQHSDAAEDRSPSANSTPAVARLQRVIELSADDDLPKPGRQASLSELEEAIEAAEYAAASAKKRELALKQDVLEAKSTHSLYQEEVSQLRSQVEHERHEHSIELTRLTAEVGVEKAKYAALLAAHQAEQGHASVCDADIEGLTAALEQEKSIRHALEQEVQGLQAMSRAGDATIMSLRMENEQFREQVSLTEHSLLLAEDDIQKQGRLHEALLDELSLMKTEHQKLQEELDRAHNASLQAVKERDDAMRVAEALRSDRGDLEAKLSESYKHAANTSSLLEQTAKELKRSRDDLMAQARGFETAHAEARSIALAGLEAREKRYAVEVAALRHTIETLQSEGVSGSASDGVKVHELETQLHLLTEELAAAHAKSERSSNLVQGVGLLINDYGKSVISSITIAEQAAVEKLDVLERRLQRLCSARNTAGAVLRVGAATVNSQLAGYRIETDRLNTEIESLTKEKAALQAELASLSGKHEAAAIALCREQTSTITELAAKVTIAESERDEAVANIATLTAMIATLTDKLEAVSGELHAVQLRESRMEARWCEAENEVQALRGKDRSLRVQVMALTEELQALRGKDRSLEGQLRALTDELEDLAIPADTYPPQQVSRLTHSPPPLSVASLDSSAP